MNVEILGLLKEIAHHKSHEAAIDKRLEWQQSAQEILNNETDHLIAPPNVCPVCGAMVHEQYNAQYRVLTVYCIVCKYEDEWDEPDKVNAAAIRY